MRACRFIIGLVSVLALVLGAVFSQVASAEARQATADSVTVYSGRGKDLVEPLFESFTSQTGIEVDVRYGGTADLASLLLEEGSRTPAQVFFAQDAGALGALAHAGRFEVLPSTLLERVDSRFVSPKGHWVGVTGRARTIVFNTDVLDETQVPDSVFDLVDPNWKGRVGWAPTNGSFQAFVTAMRKLEGEARTEQWLRGMIANDAKEYPKNSAIVRACGAGEVDLGLVNHYYLHRFKDADPGFPAANRFTEAGDPGSLINVAGVGLLRRASGSPAERNAAIELVEFLLSNEAQRQFAAETFEYPLVPGVDPVPELPALSSLNPPDIDLSELEDLQGTLELLRRVGALP